jgi:methylenetetrahydrofolate reductase (NADH)
MPAIPIKPISDLMTKIHNKEFVYTGEIEPGRNLNVNSLVEEANKIKQYVSAINITDNPGSFVTMSSLAASTYLQLKADVEVIFQLTCRDINRLGLASQLLGAAAVGIKNILVLTGDHMMLGDIPESKPVFDLDSANLLKLAREMVDKQSIYGIPIDQAEKIPPKFHIGIAANPNSTGPEIELAKIKRKVELGAEFIQTQVVYDLEKSENFFKELQKFNIPVIVGLFPMRNYSTARDFDKLVPGVSVPKDILDQFQQVKKAGLDKKEKWAAYDKINVDLIKPMIEELKKKKYAAGVHISAVKYSRIFPQLMD